MQAEKEGMQSKLAQCLAEKKILTVSRDELKAAKTGLAAELASAKAEVNLDCSFKIFY